MTGLHRPLSERWLGTVIALALAIGLDLAALPARTAGPVEAAGPACAQWDITGTWQISQGNQFHPVIQFQQNGTTLGGSVTAPADERQRAGWATSTNPLTGDLVGDRLDFTVTQSLTDGTTQYAHYLGTVVQGGVPNGVGEDLAHLDQPSIPWTGAGPTACIRLASATSAASTPAPSQVPLRSLDPEVALQDALGPYWVTGFEDFMNKVANAEDADAAGMEFQDALEGLLFYSGAAPGNVEDVRDLVWSVGYLSAAEGADGLPLVPVLRDESIVNVIMQMAYHAATEPDPATAQDWLVSTQRLVALLTNPQVVAQPSPAP
ncbi:MAG: hypothetical protein ACRDF7_00605 [Candidatus Limnocylindrales bacterium]